MLTFPYSTLRVRSYSLDILGGVISGGITMAGQQQRVNATGGGLWGLRMGFPRLNTPDQIRAWRVIQHGSDGGVVPVNIAICDLRQAPRGSSWAPSAGVPHSDESPFSDTSLYASDTIISVLAANAPARATTVRVSFEGDSVPVGGEYFSLTYGDQKHELKVVLTATMVSGSTYDLTFRPPLRAAHTAGETVTWDHPTGTFVLSSADSMSLSVEYGRWGNGDAQFIEYVG